MNGLRKHDTEQREPDTKTCILYDSIYMNSKKGKSTILEIRSVCWLG